MMLLEANVKSTISNNQKAEIILPSRTSVTIIPDLYEVDQSKPFRIGQTPLFKDKVKAISTSKIRVEYKYLEDHLSSKYERMILEGIDCLSKIASDMIYYYSSMQELVRGLDDERLMVREACIKAIAKLGTRRLEKAINHQVEKTIQFLSDTDAKCDREKIGGMWRDIDNENYRRLAMIRVYESNNQINLLKSNVPHLFVFHVDYRVDKSKVQDKAKVAS